MLRSIKNLIGYPIDALDGHLGSVKDCLFDDRHWRLRYLVADTGHWLKDQKVLVTPEHLEKPDLGWMGQRFPIALTKEEIEHCPPLESDAPVSRQYEQEYATYHKRPFYWEWPLEAEPMITRESRAQLEASMHHSDEEIRRHEERMEQISHCHLRSSKEIIGYHVQASDGELGHVSDFIMEVEKWRYQYAVIDTTNWWPGGKVLVDIGWVESFNWDEQRANVILSKEQIRHAPKFDPHEPINRDFEHRLYDYYGKPCYWEEPSTTGL